MQHFVGLLVCLTVCLSTRAADYLPGPDVNLRLAAPIRTWDEAVPLGNGLFGVLLWGEGDTLRLSLDRGDLWDERPSPAHVAVRERFNYATMQELVAQGDIAGFNRIFDSNYDYNFAPTKLPAGRIEITLAPGQRSESFLLDLATAEGRVRLADGGNIRTFVNAAAVREPVALLRLPGPAPAAIAVKPPQSVQKLGYPAAETGGAPGETWFHQPGADGFSYVAMIASKPVDDGTLLAFTVATSRDGGDPLALARARVRRALDRGYEPLFAGHRAWWAGFWNRSRLSVPDAAIMRQYHLVRYFHGAASRRSAPPMPLQGVWTADAESLPPWKGDYHNDLNTQMTYCAYLTAGHFEEGACFLDYLWNLLPTFRRFARDFYDAPGAAVPGVMSLAGQALGGWGHYSLSPTMGAWNAHLFYLHWRYTRDDTFLRERAYPFCREVALCLEYLLRPGPDGGLQLPLSTSPEIFDNTLKAFLEPNTNYDLACLRMLFLALAEMAAAGGEPDAAARWQQTAGRLGDFHTATDGTLLLDAQTALPASHRHLSNLMGIHPFNLITIEGGAADRRVIESSVKQWDALGTAAWCGYSFSWMSCLRSRVGDGEAAFRFLDLYTRAFILRNGFHANGDQTGSGLSSFTYRPFTLEGNFLAMQAVQEMLLQSWSPTPGSGDWGVIRVFPAVPAAWRTASFDGLHVEGGHRVSARREAGGTAWLRVEAGHDGAVRIRDNFDGRTPAWSREDVRLDGRDYVFTARRGEVVEAVLPPLEKGAARR